MSDTMGRTGGTTDVHPFLTGEEETPPVTSLDDTQNQEQELSVGEQIAKALADHMQGDETPVPPQETNPPVDESGNEDQGSGTGGGIATTDTPISTETQSGAGGTEGGEGSQTPSAPPALDHAQIMQAIYGRELTPNELYNALQALNQLQSLPPEQLQEIDRIISGRHTPAPTPPASTPPESTSGEETDPYVAEQIQRYIQPIQQDLAQVNDFVSRQQQQQMEDQRMAIARGVEVAASSFSTVHTLTEDESAQLQLAAAQSGVFPIYLQRNGGNAERAMNELLETVYWNTPTFREREIQRQLAAERQQVEETMKRQRKAGALAPGGGNVSRDAPPPSNPQERRGAMVAEIAKAMEQE